MEGWCSTVGGSGWRVAVTPEVSSQKRKGVLSFTLQITVWREQSLLLVLHDWCGTASWSAGLSKTNTRLSHLPQPNNNLGFRAMSGYNVSVSVSEDRTREPTHSWWSCTLLWEWVYTAPASSHPWAVFLKGAQTNKKLFKSCQFTLSSPSPVYAI